MKKRYLRLAALTAGVLLTAQTGLSAAALSTFDAAYYAAQYPDVAAVCGNDEGALLRHYLDHGIDEGRKPSADGIAGDDELSLTEAQFSSVWSPVAINKLAHYKSLKRKCTDEEFAQAYQEALKVVTPLALMSREDQLYGIASALRAVVDDGSMAYSMEANHYNDPYGYFVLRTASCAGCARATALCLDILGIPYEHVNENQYAHQWCRVPMEDGSYWICDAFGLYCGPEPEPYQHPYFLKMRINHFKIMQCPAGCVICRALFFPFPFYKTTALCRKVTNRYGFTGCS